ncbi:hypothetical protein B0O80DRAFT_186879 [Mortierella sp. GBAus27b]|nr:hypothetical protein B0O80DRAFT_186879 [Mortierella sp. GBAus27b]
MDFMDRMNPLEIPEIRIIVAQFLSQSDLARCLRVSKPWYNSFLPHLWSTVAIAELLPNPTAEALSHHRLLVKHLLYHTSVWSQYKSIEYPNLKHLTVFGRSIDPESIWEPVQDPHNLSRLRLDRIRVKSSHTEAIWQLCTRLEWLQIDDTAITEPPQKSIVFERLKGLSLSLRSRIPFQSQMDLINQCPNLTSLEWRCFERATKEEMNDMAARFETGTWSKLRELKLSFYGSDAQLAKIIGGIETATKLEVLGCEFDQLSLVSLRRHFQSLKYLCIVNYSAAVSPMVTEALTSCPQLEVLRVGIVMSQDIISSRPWVCEHSMRTFSASFKITNEEDSDDHHWRILQRLSRFVNLESLALSNYCSSYNPWQMDLRLSGCLEQLATLKKLKDLRFVFYDPQLTSANIEWMINHWKNLELVSGILNPNKSVNGDLSAMLTQAGIKYSRW